MTISVEIITDTLLYVQISSEASLSVEKWFISIFQSKRIDAVDMRYSKERKYSN